MATLDERELHKVTEELTQRDPNLVRQRRIRRKLEEVRERSKPRTQVKMRPLKSDPRFLNENYDPSYLMGTGMEDENVFVARRGKEEVEGSFKYVRPTTGPGGKKYPGNIDVGYIGGTNRQIVDWEKTKHKTMSKQFVKDLLTRVAKQYPKAETLTGLRVTGAHSEGRNPYQSFNLNKIREAALRGVKKGRKLGLLGALLPLAQRAATQYANKQGGS